MTNIDTRRACGAVTRYEHRAERLLQQMFEFSETADDGGQTRPAVPPPDPGSGNKRQQTG